MRNVLGISRSLSLFLFAVAASYSLPSSNDHLVTDLLGFDNKSDVKLDRNWAGHLPISENNDKNKLFYWLWEAQSSAKEAPLLVWLNGGPGCSSMAGMFLENGPIRVSKIKKGNKKKSHHGQFEVNINPSSWNRVANMLYIDQPVGTGLSYTDEGLFPNSLHEVSEQLWGFMQNFLRVHSEFVGRDIFLCGESYAGSYIPNFAKFCLEASLKSGDNALSIKGTAIGGPYTDPYWQYSVAEYAFSAGLISEWQLQRLQEYEKLCHADLNAENYSSPTCNYQLDKVVFEAGNPCVYDIRLNSCPDSGPDKFPPNTETYTEYLNNDIVRDKINALGLTNIFEECANTPFKHLYKVLGKSQAESVKILLENDIHVLLFSGQFDLICNHIMIEKWLNRLEWSGAKDFRTTQRALWKVHGKVAGYINSGGGLDYVLVKGAGHMVPMDVPEASLDLISRFINGKTFADFAPNVLKSSEIQESSPSVLRTESIKNCSKGSYSCVYKFDFFLLPGSMGGDIVINSISRAFSGRGTSSGLSYAHSINAILANDLSQAFDLPLSSVQIMNISIPSTEELDGMQQSSVLVNAIITTSGNTSPDTVRTVASAWNDAHSALHTGVLTQNINCLSSPSFQLSREINGSHYGLTQTMYLSAVIALLCAAICYFCALFRRKNNRIALLQSRQNWRSIPNGTIEPEEEF